jgi:hypothetical protein
VPPGVVVDVATDMVELPPLVTDAGLKVAVAPAGSADAPRLTLCAEPAVVAVEMV